MTAEMNNTWSVAAAQTLYAMDSWSDGFFFVNQQGHVGIRPQTDGKLEIDIADVIKAAVEEGCTMPLLIRFQDIITARVHRLNRKFRDAIAEAGYDNEYRCVYPIKVNQLHEVVAEVLDAGREFNIGLECGSRAELMAALPLVGDAHLLLCNGVKDQTMLTMILNAQQIGQQVLPVIEKYSEFEQLLKLAESRGFVPRLGVRVKLSTKGSGRWFESGGSSSKFGLTVPELIHLVQVLESKDCRDSLQLLHFHLGSQIADIQVLRSAVREISQIYADLSLRGLSIRFLDVGGGLGVNYGGDADSPESTINYGLREYANIVVFAVKEICDERGVSVPVLLSESGRALTAHHSVLVVPVLGVHRPDSPPVSATAGKNHAVVKRMKQTLQEVKAARNTGMLLEAFHDACEIREEAEQLARLGYLPLAQLAQADSLYWTNCREILRQLTEAELSPPPPEQLALEHQLTDLYLCDFSVFQSIPDHWAIGQVFPVMPLTRLQEKPERRAQLVDLTCDSDGKISEYVSANTDRSWLPLHVPQLEQEPYYLGIFLVGAYQEILGDAHNLLGRVGEVHVFANADEPGHFFIEEIIRGISIKDMLSQVQYFPNDLDRRMSEFIKRKIDAGVVKPAEGMRILNNYVRHLDDTTYCDVPGKA
ncbi:MAG: biosynthetic arginine decarboxylase [Pseudomonadales bacterium]|nr:biosynthetic arginine decarboxylase [Pseudomonadales bacterium]